MANPTSGDGEDVSIRAYARHRGVSHTAVRKALEDGRIGEALRNKDGVLRINVREADLLWDQRTDPGQSRSGPPPPPEPTVQLRMFGPERPPPPPVASPAPSAARSDVGSEYRRAAALRQTYQAQLAKLDVDERMGRLVLAEEVRLEARSRARTLRERLLALPDRLAEELALERAPHAVRAILLRELRAMLTELADAPSEG